MSLFLLLLIFLVFFPLFVFSPNGGVLSIENRGDWERYENEEFSFSFEYPPDWTVVESEDSAPSPSFHVLPSEVDLEDIDLITHHKNMTQFSVYPEGYPSEGVFGQSRSFPIYFAGSAEELIEYYLSDGSVWARMVTPKNAPSSWSEHGFVWSASYIEKYKVTCFDRGEEIDRYECDPALGHEIRRSGSIDPLESPVLEEMIRSFRFQGRP